MYFAIYLLCLCFYNVCTNVRAVLSVTHTVEYSYHLKNQQLFFDMALSRVSRETAVETLCSSDRAS